MIKTTIAALAALLGAQSASAAVTSSVSRGTHDDAFEGAAVLELSPISSFAITPTYDPLDPRVSAQEVFGASRTIPEPGNLLFSNLAPSLTFDLGSPVIISQIVTYLADDSNNPYSVGEERFNRGVSLIVFEAGSSIQTLQEIGRQSISPDYRTNYGSSVIAASIDIANPSAYRFYRFSAVNANSVGGARVLEIDGFAAAIPEPSTWALLLVGFSMVGAVARYRRRSTATTFA